MANLLEKANILITPTAYSDGKIHSAKPIKSLSAEKVVNGDFSSDTNWLKDSSWTISGGSANYDAVSSNHDLEQAITLTEGSVYAITFEIKSGEFRGRFLSLNSSIIENNNYTVGTHTVYGSVSAGSNLFVIKAVNTTGGSSFSIDNVSVKEVIDSDLNFTRGSAGTRVNAQGLVENVDTLGSEEVVNGDFATDSDWILENGAIINNGSVNIIGAGSRFKQDVLTVGKTYKLDYEVISTNGASFRFQDGVTAFVDINQTVGIHTYYFEATGVRTQFQAVGDINARIDNVSVKEVIDVTNIPRINYKDFQYEDSLGSEEVVNGDFATDSDWTKGSGWTISGGKAVGSNSSSSLYQATGSNYTSGKTYKIVFTVSDYVSGSVRPEVTNIYGNYITSNGTFTQYIVATSSSIGGELKGASFNGSITNVSVKEVTKVVTPNSGVGSWLIEPQSTNLITYSEDFSSLNIRNNAVVTSNSIISPSGLLDADEITFDGTSVGRVESSIATTIGQPYTISLYLKNKDLSDVTQVWVGFSQGGQGQFVTITNEWQRYDITTNADGTTEYPRIQFSGSGSLYAWGFQTEQQSYASSYIPTNGSVQTRLAETASRSGLGDLIDSIQGVFYAEISALYDGVDYRELSLSDGTDANRIEIRYSVVLKRIQCLFRLSGSIQANLTFIASDVTDFNKVGFKFKENDFALWVNGVEIDTDTSGNTFSENTLNRIGFDEGSGSDINDFKGNIKAVAVLPILTDEELECLTTR